MFSYTDDAIVTSSPTGRHLSTVIRRPCVLMSGWAEHAEQVCKVLNELDSKAKATRLTYSLSLEPGVQVAGRPKRDTQLDEAILRLYPDGPTSEQIRAESCMANEKFDATADPRDFGPIAFATPGERITDLEKQVSSLETECLNTREQLKKKPKNSSTIRRADWRQICL